MLALDIGVNKQRPRVTLICTGGTISMRFDPVSGGAVPALSGAALLAMVPGLADLAEIDLLDFSLLPGPHMTPPKMLELAGQIRARLELESQAGVVVTHGTDTLEECAYLASLVLQSPKPVVFVGAMRNSSEPGWDGPPNLHAALRVAVAKEARGLGVLVVMGDQVLSATDATKTHTESLHTFQSRDLGPLGLVDKDRILILRRPLPGHTIPEAVLEDRVEIAQLSAGSDGRILELLVQSGCRGLILEGLGRGNVPPATVESVRRVIEKNIPIILTSRCPRGRVLDTYAYEGGGRRLREMGVILGGLLPSPKARLKLMLLLGAGYSLPQIRKAFED